MDHFDIVLHRTVKLDWQDWRYLKRKRNEFFKNRLNFVIFLKLWIVWNIYSSTRIYVAIWVRSIDIQFVWLKVFFETKEWNKVSFILLPSVITCYYYQKCLWMTGQYNEPETFFKLSLFVSSYPLLTWNNLKFHFDNRKNLNRLWFSEKLMMNIYVYLDMIFIEKIRNRFQHLNSITVAGLALPKAGTKVRRGPLWVQCYTLVGGWMTIAARRTFIASGLLPWWWFARGVV